MKRNEKGYSLLVLIIAIAVILIIAGGAITTLNFSMEERKINNFIYDMNNIEDAVMQYYSSTGVIPSSGVEEGDISAIGAQLGSDDGDTYYVLDLSKLDLNNIHEKDKTYIINTDSLRVYMLEGIEYKGNTYYTVTDTLMGKSSNYETQNLDMVCTVSPTSWAQVVNIRATIANVSTNLEDWTFKYNIGPKDLSFFGSDGNTFEYGSSIRVTTNGVYSIYAKDPDGNEWLKNVVVNNIDDIAPKYTISDGNITIMDDETGLKEIRYKTRSQYNTNQSRYTAEQQATRNELDYYLMDGKGNTIDSIKNDITTYKKSLQELENSKTRLTQNFNALSEEEQEMQREGYDYDLAASNTAINALKTQYSYILDEDTEYVLYAEDIAGNGTAIVNEILTFKKVCETFNIEMP
ncbi:MAG: hypothetical protein IJ217_05940 [Clostridia bacterium]|nr:hypothetical protein [Clostridia bacterium]